MSPLAHTGKGSPNGTRRRKARVAPARARGQRGCPLLRFQRWSKASATAARWRRIRRFYARLHGANRNTSCDHAIHATAR
jgi:hypothetical protein